MLSEKQIRKETPELGRLKRRHAKMLKACRRGSKSYKKHTEQIVILRAQIKVIRHLLKGNWIDFKAIKSEAEEKGFILKMKQIKSLVRETLTHDMESRDDDNILCFKIWEKQGSTPNMTYRSLQAKLISGKFASPESVGRIRRALQQRYISLRGKLYDKRHQADERFKNQYKLDI